MRKNINDIKKKNNKLLAIALSISIVTSCFSGIGINYARTEAAKKDEAINSNEVIEGTTELAPAPNITEMKPEISNDKIPVSKSMVGTYGEKDNTKESDTDITNNKSITNNSMLVSNDGSVSFVESVSDSDEQLSDNTADQDEYNSLIAKGYSETDVAEAISIRNETGIEPQTLLEKKHKSKKTLNEAKEDILSERKGKVDEKLKKNYKEEYDKLTKEGFDKEDILSLLRYIDMNGLKLTDEIISQYKADGELMFINNPSPKISKESKEKYDLTELDTNNLTERDLQTMVKISKDTNTSVKELVEAYLEYHKGDE